MRPRKLTQRFVTEALEPRLLMATVTGFMFNDQNGNGVRDGGGFPFPFPDPGLSGWTIYRDTNNNSQLDAGEASDVTSASGAYSLSFNVVASPLSPAVVTIREVQQPGWRPTNPDTGAGIVVFTSNSQSRTLDFMNTQRPQVSGTVYHDTDGDGRIDRESGVAGWTVFADQDDDGQLDSLEASDVSDANGDYVLNPPGGAVTIRQVPQPNWRTSSSSSFDLTLDNAEIVTRNFLNTQRSLISGTVFEDLNADGDRDTGDPGVAGWTVYLDDNGNDVFDAGEVSDVTGSNGNYALTPLGPGLGFDITAVRQVPQSGWTRTRPQSGQHQVAVILGSVSTGLDFGNARPARVTGTTFHDLNANGVRDAGEPGLGGRIIYSDADNDNIFDDGSIPRTTSQTNDLNTSHSARVTSSIAIADRSPKILDIDVGVDFTHPNVGDLSVWLISPYGTRVELFSNVGGSSNDIASLTLDDQASTSITSASPPFFLDTYRPEQPLSLLNGENPNGTWKLEIADANPSSSLGTLNDWRLRITSAEYSINVPFGGNFVLANLPPGDHEIRMEPLNDYKQTMPASNAGHMLTLTSNQSVSGNDFGSARPGMINGIVFNDHDGQGDRDAGDEGLPGMTVYRDANNNGQLDTHSFVKNWTSPLPLALHDATSFQGVDIPSFNIAVPFIAPQGLDGLLVDVDIELDILHLRPSDLQITLLSPDGSVVLFDRNGGNGAMISNTVFDDQAATSIANANPPFSGSFRPVGSLGDLDGINPNGLWTLVIMDWKAGPTGSGDPAGYLLGWQLRLTYGDPRRVTGADGSYMFDRVVPGATEHMRLASRQGWEQTAPTGGVHDLFVNSSQNHSSRNFGIHDVPPIVTTADFLFETAQRVVLGFDDNVSASLAAGDLLVKNLTTGQTIPVTSLSFDASTNVATAQFGQLLPDGDYRLTLPAASVQDGGGNLLANDFNFEFFVLAGDADHDRDVDVNDLGILASNWQLSPRTFSQGDFDYSGTVDVNDLGILASHWQQQLASPSAPFASTARRTGRMVEQII